MLIRFPGFARESYKGRGRRGSGRGPKHYGATNALHTIHPYCARSAHTREGVVGEAAGAKAPGALFDSRARARESRNRRFPYLK